MTINATESAEAAASGQARHQTNGAAWAGILAAGIGCAAFGLTTDLAECSARVNGALAWYPPAGGLSGVAGCAVLVWLGAWGLLHVQWKRRHFLRTSRMIALTLILLLLGLLATFPPFYELFVPGG